MPYLEVRPGSRERSASGQPRAGIPVWCPSFTKAVTSLLARTLDASNRFTLGAVTS